MKLAIISDIHDNLANLEKFLAVFKQECSTPGVGQDRKVEPCGIICCGDVTTPETLKYLVEGFSGPIKLVCGNAEIRREEFFTLADNFPNLEVFAERGQWQIGRFKIAFSHKPDKVHELSSYDFIFYGHTHKPWFKEITKASAGKQGESLITIFVANPGTLGGVFTPPTFACLDTSTGRLELKRLWR